AFDGPGNCLFPSDLDCFHLQGLTYCPQCSNSVRFCPVRPTALGQVGSPLEVTFQAQTFQSLGLSSRTDHGIFIDHTVVYPAIALDVCLCLDLHAKGINLDSFQSLGFSSG